MKHVLCLTVYILHALLGIADNFADTFLEGRFVRAPHDGGIDVSGRIVIGVGQHGNHRDDDGFDA